MNWKEELKNFKTIDKFDNLKKLIAILYINNNTNEYFYRGQANYEWDLNSSYFRILKAPKSKNLKLKDFDIRENMIFIFKDRIKYFRINNNIDKGNLELLSEMQHSDIKTPLIDFTSNFLHALWFAFSHENEHECKCKCERKDIEYKSIFILNNTKKIKNKIDDLAEKNYLYNCPPNIARGLTQKSYFILDNQDWKEEEKENIFKINISNGLLDKIILFLIKKDIDASKIYPDLKGLMMMYETVSVLYFLEKGLTFIREGDLNNAFKFYDRATKLDINCARAHYNKGSTWARQGRDYESSNCYKEAIKCYEEAYKCYDAATKIEPENEYMRSTKIGVETKLKNSKKQLNNVL